MFVQPEFLLELNCSDFFSTCNYCMLLAKWIPSNVFLFILYHRWFTVWRRPFWYPGYSSGNTAPHKSVAQGSLGLFGAPRCCPTTRGLSLAIPASLCALRLCPVSPTKGQFRVTFSLCIKMSLRAKPLHMKMCFACRFIFILIKLIESFALVRSFRNKHKVTRNWPFVLPFLLLF